MRDEARAERSGRTHPKTNRLRWCRGRQGVEHYWRWVEDTVQMQRFRLIGRLPENVVISCLRCTVCGKHPPFGEGRQGLVYERQGGVLVRYFGPAFGKGSWR